MDMPGSILDQELYSTHAGMPWQAFSAIASQYGHAVRGAFTQDAQKITNGHVEQSQPLHAPLTGSKLSDPPELQTPAVSDESHAAVGKAGAVGTSHSTVAEAVQAEIKKVKRKVMSADASKEVILRFNFMSGSESRVCQLGCDECAR